MRRVLLTHAESPVGKRVVKALFHDPEVSLVLALGTGSEPTYLAPYKGKIAYQRLDLAKARHLQSFLHSERFARARPDSVIHLPASARADQHTPGGVHSLVSRRAGWSRSAPKSSIERFVYLVGVRVTPSRNGSVVGEGRCSGSTARATHSCARGSTPIWSVRRAPATRCA
jgi:hypothetical protein